MPVTMTWNITAEKERAMYDYERYGIKNGQTYVPADGSKTKVTVIDVTTYAECGDVVVDNGIQEYRIDCFKLAMVRYSLEKTV